MPRRVPDYPNAYLGWNYYSSLGSLISFLGSLLFFYIIYQIFVFEDSKSLEYGLSDLFIWQLSNVQFWKTIKQTNIVSVNFWESVQWISLTATSIRKHIIKSVH
jgi:heme/copper-type cytochrome/quinol oxidase subunit 1